MTDAVAVFVTLRLGLPATAAGFATWTLPRDGVPPTASELPPKLWAPARIFVKKFTVPVELVMLTVNSYVQTSLVPLILRNGCTPKLTPLDVVNVKRLS